MRQRNILPTHALTGDQTQCVLGPEVPVTTQLPAILVWSALKNVSSKHNWKGEIIGALKLLDQVMKVLERVVKTCIWVPWCCLYPKKIRDEPHQEQTPLSSSIWSKPSTGYPGKSCGSTAIRRARVQKWLFKNQYVTDFILANSHRQTYEVYKYQYHNCIFKTKCCSF